jgi:transposase
MRETITMTVDEQQRCTVLTRLVAGELGLSEAAVLLELSERQTWRLKRAFLARGPAALVHGNRGRASPRRVSDELRSQVLSLAQTKYDGANDCHLTELLVEHEGISLSRVVVRRILRAGGRASPRRRRPARHRARRVRMPQAGLLLQLDGSRHDWLEGRGPKLTLLAVVDDATGSVTAATFRDQEDAAGYFEVLRATVHAYGLPVAVYHDRAGTFEQPAAKQPPKDLRLADTRLPTQVGRALNELGIRSISAYSPQAKGRVERLFGTFQDRLVTELRLAGVSERMGAERLLRRFIPRHNARFAVAPADPTSGWRPVPDDLDLDATLCFRYRRVVAKDHTVHIGGIVLDLPSTAAGTSYAGRRIELSLRLDGRIMARLNDAWLLIERIRFDDARLRSLESARPVLDRPGPTLLAAERPYVHGPNHSWRRVRPESKLGIRLREEARRLTDSLTS